MQVLFTGKIKCTSSDNATLTAVGSCSVHLNSEGEGWGILKEQELAGVHEKPRDLQRIPKDTKEVPRQDVSRQPMEEQEIPNQPMPSSRRMWTESRRFSWKERKTGIRKVG